MKELAADAIPVAVTCRVLKLTRQPHYRWLTAPVTDRDLQQAYLADALFDAHRDDPEYGYRLLGDEAREAGHDGCDRTIWRVCADNGWWSVFGEERAEDGKKPGPPAHDDLGRRNFTATKANQLWLTRSPSTRPAKASCTSAPSETSTPDGSWATPSATA